ncbi:MAG: dTDP-4-dehydrorhamnose reductase [Segniliparus sp.]|uniref:dTDP-4-dehydrorhamnose reductase n=1 Tax=Segniliparus sp. TaxID=2804064 RepID=UPI003F2F3E19
MNARVERLVITGAGGQVGSRLAKVAREHDYNVLALSRAQLDICDEDAVAETVRPGDVVVNCAAETKVDTAESDSENAHRINAEAVGNLAKACARTGARLIHVSTDYVFAGQEEGWFSVRLARPYETDDEPRPIQVYGESKLAGERLAFEHNPRSVVVRTSWVYSGERNGRDFVSIAREQSQGSGTMRAVTDQVGSPTHSADLVYGLMELVWRGDEGALLQFCNTGGCSRYDLARAVFEEMGADPGRVRPCMSWELSRPAPRPPYSVLSVASWVQSGLRPPRAWRDALRYALQHG